jgi:nitrite reductase (NO-forming)
MTTDRTEQRGYTRRNFMKGLGTAAAAGGLAGLAPLSGDRGTVQAEPFAGLSDEPNNTFARVVADPTDIPGPIDRHSPSHHEIVLESVEIESEIEPGVTFKFMTFNGQIPGPMIRVRQGDTIKFTMKNPPENNMPHNVDFHAVYGPGGGAVATTASPGASGSMSFKAMYPGAFCYHCAIPNLDYHISSGMFGLIVVEPPEGLPRVDREFYVGQHEVYTSKETGEKGQHDFDFETMKREDPSYVLLNGGKYALTPDRFGAMEANVGETARVFFVNGGPNLTTSFHPIGNVFTKAWRDGAIQSNPERNVQTVTVPPGSGGIYEMDFVVPGQVKLVDHALSRVARKGMMGIIDVKGEPQASIFDPDWSPEVG